MSRLLKFLSVYKKKSILGLLERNSRADSDQYFVL
jgi:hypothetical protein